MAMSIQIRSAAASDLPSIAALYEHYVRTCTCTFDTEPPPGAYWDGWLAEHGEGYPAIVAFAGDQFVGWGSLSRWNKRCAYRFSVEDSVYVQPQCHGQGIGRTILAELIALARTHGHRNIIAQIADGQPASDALHAGLGFRRVGRLDEVGCKFGRWIGVGIWQLQLQPRDASHDGSACR